MKGGIFMRFISTFFAFLFAITIFTNCSKKDEGNVVAKVGSQKIYEKDINKRIETALKQMSGGRQIPQQQMEMFKKQYFKPVREEFIKKAIILESATKEDKNISKQEIDSVINLIKTKFGPQYDTFVKENYETEDNLKEEIKKNLIIEKVYNRITAFVDSLPEDSLKQYYDTHQKEFSKPEMVKASHILIKFDSSDTPKSKKAKLAKAKKILRKVKHGADFAKTAKENSDCPSAKKGGDLGYFKRGDMVKPFEDAAFALKKGQISNIVTTRFGYHIIKVFDHKPAEVSPMDSVKTKIIDDLKMQYFDKWMAEQRKKLNVQVFEPKPQTPPTNNKTNKTQKTKQSPDKKK